MRDAFFASAAVLILLGTVFFAVLVLSIILLVVLIAALIAILVVHNNFLRFCLSAVFRLDSLSQNSGFILCLKDETC